MFPSSEKREYTFRTLIQYWAIAIVVLLLLGFVVFQARFLITGPQIVLFDFTSGPHNTQQIVLKGTAYNIARLWLNDRPIYTDAEGNFKEAIVLENGYTITTLRAEDRYGRTTRLTRPLVYVPASFAQ